MNRLRNILHNGTTVLLGGLLVLATVGVIFTLRQPNVPAGSPVSQLASTSTVIQSLTNTATPTAGYTPPGSGIVGKIIVSPTPGPPTSTPIPTPTLPYSEKIQVEQAIDLEQQFIDEYQAGNLSALTDKVMNVDDIKVKFESWSPNGQYMLLKIKTGETLKGKLPISVYNTGMGQAIVPVYDLWLADSDGSPLSLIAEKASWSAWSPDSKLIAYTHGTVIDSIITDELWVMKVGKSAHQKIFSGVRSISWLDNQTLTFVDTKDEQLQLLASVIDKEIKPFVLDNFPTNSSQVIMYEFSPNHRQLAVKIRGVTGISIADVIGENAEFTTEFQMPSVGHFAWAPNGRTLALSPRCTNKELEYMPSCKQIQIIYPDGQIMSQIEGNRSRTDITWSSDSKSILFHDTATLYLADVENGKTTVLYQFPSDEDANSQGAKWSPDSAKIGFNKHSLGGATILIVQ